MGEDGILSWLTDLIENIPKTFIEFGVSDYQESNTRYLLQSRNWSGLVLDGLEENITHIRQQNYYWRHELIAKRAFIDCGNINNLIREKTAFMVKLEY